MGPFSPLEALRATLAIVMVVLHVYAYSRTHEGRGAFALPVRDVMLRRRRFSVFVTGSVCLVWAVQAFDAGTVEGIWPPTPQGIVLSVSVIYTVGSLGILAWNQLSGWASFERLTGLHPLYPSGIDPAGYVASLETRPILHEARNRAAEVVGKLELARTPQELWEMRDSIVKSVLEVSALQEQAQVLVQSLSKPGEPREE